MAADAPALFSAAWLPGARIALAGATANVDIMDLGRTRVDSRLSEHVAPVTSVAASSAGLLAVLSGDGTVTLCVRWGGGTARSPH